MKAPAQAKPEPQEQTAAPLQTAVPQEGEQQALLSDQRPEAAIQRQRQQLANDSPQARQLRGQAQLMQSGPRALQMRTLAASLRGDQRTPVQAQAACSNVLQANGLALGLLEEGGSFTLSYLKGVLAKHGLSSISEVLLNACSYLITQQITDALASYTAVMTPYLAILRQAKTALAALQAIPAPVTTVLAFGIGWCVASFSSRWLKGYFTEPMIHAILTGTGDFIAGLTALITWLDDSINAPASVVYRGVHGILSGIYAYLTGSSSVSSPPSDGPPDDSGSQPPRAQSQAPAPMIDTKLGFMWAKMEAPKLAKWDGEESEPERAGMEIDGGFGFNLFGHGMDIDGLQFRVPYGGDWRLNFTSEYTIASDIELAGIFSVGSVVATNISVNRDGLQSVAIKIRDITVGDDVIDNGTLDMAYARGKKELDFAGSADMSVFGHSVHGAFGLGMGLDGSLKRGALDIKSRERFTLLGGKLAVNNPAFGAKFGPGMADISVLGDVELAIYKGIKATGTALRIAYEGGKLSGCIAKLTVDIPISPQMAVQLELTEGKVDANGFAAEKALIRVSYIAAPPQPVAQSGASSGSSGVSASESVPEAASIKPPALKPADLDSLLPGFDMSWIKAAGIETLVAEASASKVKLNGEGLAAESTEKRIARFAAQMFGVRAEFDADKGSGSIGGQTPVKELAAGFHIPFPIVPGFNGYIEMNASLAMSAGLKGTATKTPPKRGNKMPWLLGAEANARADGELSMSLGGAFGLGPLASLNAELYGAFNPSLLGTASASGMVLFDESSGSISQSAVAKEQPKGSYRLVAQLSAQVSLRLRAQALFIFSRTLYEVRLKEWNLGQYVVEGKFASDADGDLKLEGKPSHQFNGKAKPGAPEADSVEISSLTFLQRLQANPRTKVSDKFLVYRVLHDMFDPTAGLSEKEQELYLPILRQAVEGDATSVNLEAILDQIALRKGATSKTDEAQPTHIMAPAEWLDYSTTTGLLGDINERKSVKPIDAEVLAYSRSAPKDYASRIAIIKKLVPLCEGYSGSREKMVLRLKFGAQRELELLENLKQAV